MTFDSTEQAYSLTKSNSPNVNTGERTVLLNNVSISDTSTIIMDLKLPSSQTGNVQPRLGLFNGDNGVSFCWTYPQDVNYIRWVSHNKTSNGSNIGSIVNTPNLTGGNWYTLEAHYNGTSLEGIIKDSNGDALYTVSATSSSILSSSNQLGIQISYDRYKTFYVKNITVL